MSKLSERLVERIKGAVQQTRLKRLGVDEKRALLRLLQEVAVADGVLSAAEDAKVRDAARELGVELTKDLQLPEAVALLAAKPAALELACLVVADAFFADADYDDSEKRFVDTFGERFKLPANPLKDAVEALRKRKLDDALAEWNKEIG